MLSATATERVVNGVHRDPANAWVLRPARFHLVIFVSCLDERLLRPSTACDDTDRRPALWIEAFDFAAWQLDDRSLAVVGNQIRTDTRGTSESSAVARLGLNVTDRNPFRDLCER